MTAAEIAGTAIAAVTALAGALWWGAKRLMGVGRDRFEQEVARDLTRTTILKLDGKVDGVVAGMHTQDKQLAILVHSAGEVSKRLDELTATVDEHGNRLTALEATK